MTIQGQGKEQKKALLKTCGGRGAYLWNSQELSHVIKTLTATPTSSSTPTHDTSQTCSKEDIKQMISSLLRNRGIFHPRPMAGQKRRNEETLFPHIISEIMSLVKDKENEQQVTVEEDTITQLIADVVNDRHFIKTSHHIYQEGYESKVQDQKESCSNDKDDGNNRYFTTPSAITKRVYAQVIYKHLTCNDVKVRNAVDADGSRNDTLSTATHQFLEKLGKLAKLEIDAFEVYLFLHLESIEMNLRFVDIGDATIEKDETDIDAKQKAFHATMSSAIVDIVEKHPSMICKLPSELVIVLAQKDFSFAKAASKGIMRCIVEYSAMIPTYTCEQVESENKRKRSRDTRDDPFKMLENCRKLYVQWNDTSVDMKHLWNMQFKVFIDRFESKQLVALRDFVTSCRDEKFK